MAYTYTKEIAEAGINHVVPGYAPFSEAYFYLQEATEADWNSMVQSIGISELGVFEATGVEVVYEEGTEGNEKNQNAIVKFFAEAWKRIKGLFDKAIEAIQTACTNAKNKFKNNMYKNITNRLKAEKEVKDKDGNTKTESIKYGKWYTYDHLGIAMNRTAENLTGVGNGDGNNEGLLENLRGKAVDVTRDYLLEGENWDKIVDYAFEFKFTKKQIVGNYTEVKKAFDEAVKAAKSGKAGKEAIDAARAKVTKLNKYASVVCKAYHERQRLAIGIVSKVVVHTMKKSEGEKADEKAMKANKKAANARKPEEKPEEKKEEGTKESALVAESYSTEIERLFDWDF